MLLPSNNDVLETSSAMQAYYEDKWKNPPPSVCPFTPSYTQSSAQRSAECDKAITEGKKLLALTPKYSRP